MLKNPGSVGSALRPGGCRQAQNTCVCVLQKADMQEWVGMGLMERLIREGRPTTHPPSLIGRFYTS